MEKGPNSFSPLSGTTSERGWKQSSPGMDLGPQPSPISQSHTCASAPQSGIAPLGLCWQLRVKLRLQSRSCCIGHNPAAPLGHGETRSPERAHLRIQVAGTAPTSHFIYQRHWMDSILPVSSQSSLFQGTIPACRQVEAAPMGVDWSCASCWSRDGHL